MPRLVLEHRRRTRPEGVWTMATALLTMAALVGFETAFFPSARERDPTFHYVFCGGAILIGCFVVFLFAIPNIWMNREFRFSLFEDRMECDCPARIFGESFRVLLDEIACIEECERCDSLFWTVVTRDGRRIGITHNYGNPVQEIINELFRLRPDLPTVDRRKHRLAESRESAR